MFPKSVERRRSSDFEMDSCCSFSSLSPTIPANISSEVMNIQDQEPVEPSPEVENPPCPKSSSFLSIADYIKKPEPPMEKPINLSRDSNCWPYSSPSKVPAEVNNNQYQVVQYPGEEEPPCPKVLTSPNDYTIPRQPEETDDTSTITGGPMNSSISVDSGINVMDCLTDVEMERRCSDSCYSSSSLTSVPTTSPTGVMGIQYQGLVEQYLREEEPPFFKPQSFPNDYIKRIILETDDVKIKPTVTPAKDMNFVRCRDPLELCSKEKKPSQPVKTGVKRKIIEEPINLKMSDSLTDDIVNAKRMKLSNELSDDLKQWSVSPKKRKDLRKKVITSVRKFEREMAYCHLHRPGFNEIKPSANSSPTKEQESNKRRRAGPRCALCQNHTVKDPLTRVREKAPKSRGHVCQYEKRHDKFGIFEDQYKDSNSLIYQYRDKTRKFRRFKICRDCEITRIKRGAVKHEQKSKRNKNKKKKGKNDDDYFSSSSDDVSDSSEGPEDDDEYLCVCPANKHKKLKTREEHNNGRSGMSPQSSCETLSPVTPLPSEPVKPCFDIRLLTAEQFREIGERYFHDEIHRLCELKALVTLGTTVDQWKLYIYTLLGLIGAQKLQSPFMKK